MTVYANGREISGKATPNKTIAAFPDVCMSPPSPPAGPIPLPYPITGVASNTTDGTSSVYVRGKEAGKKNGVKYSKVDGNQPATQSFGAGVISHKITGPLKFAAYSFDVFLEKGGAERFMDMTTQNHTNQGNTRLVSTQRGRPEAGVDHRTARRCGRNSMGIGQRSRRSRLRVRQASKASHSKTVSNAVRSPAQTPAQVACNMAPATNCLQIAPGAFPTDPTTRRRRQPDILPMVRRHQTLATAPPKSRMQPVAILAMPK